MNRLAGALATAVMVGIGAHAATAADISGAGATFPYPVYAKWAEAYKQETGIGLNYQSIGSGGGIKQITAETVTFGASDMPMKAEDLAKNGLVQWPQIMGGVVPAINVPGIAPGQIVLDGKTLAEIYLGNVTAWNDPAIQKLNPGIELPDTAIAPVYRSDGSGTSFLFTNYLSKVSPTFQAEIGSSTSVQWPVGVGAKGNEGVANMVRQIEGAVGYVEYAYVKQNRMTYAKLKNQAGQAVEPGAESFQAAAANADWAAAPGMGEILTDEPGERSWPITGASFILMHKEPKDPTVARQALDFFAWAFAKGAPMAQALDYVPMPDEVVVRIQEAWKTDIKGAGGQPLWTASR
jgi:phosphate transport system substrate-binding protein